MTAGVYDITIEVGATFRLPVIWEDPDGNPIDNTGYEARMKVKKKYSDTVALLEFTTTGGQIVLGGVDGSVTVKGLATVTEGVTAKYGVYDLEMVAPNGDVDRILMGDVEFSPEVTTS